MEAPIIPICKRLFLASILSLGAIAPAGADTARLADYLKARAADADCRVDLAVAGYARALAGAPDSTAVALHAYREALAAGDIPLAVRAAGVLRGTPQAPGDLPLLPLAIAAQKQDIAGAEAATAALARTPLAVLVPSLNAWIAFAKGSGAAPALSTTGQDPITQRLLAETRALLLIAGDKPDEGLAMVQALRSSGSPIDLRLSAAQLLFGRGKDAEARALLAGSDPVFVALRKGAPARATLGFGVSRLLGRIAGDLADQDAAPLTIALARGALVAYPANDRVRLLLAGALAGQGATANALSTLDAIRPDSAFTTTATSERIDILARAGRDDEALALARRDAERPGAGEPDWQRYADRLTAMGRPGDAAPWYRRVLDADPAAWSAWLQYGGALEQAGDWPAGRAALQKAVALGPDEPLALNYLGYAQASRGVDVAASTAMLERAHALKPEDHSITDSLGWAYVRDRQVTRALPLLESAAKGDPVNAEIGEHLGDVYWLLGRRFEARYAWRAAVLTAAAKDVPRLRTKIAGGLPAHGART